MAHPPMGSLGTASGIPKGIIEVLEALGSLGANGTYTVYNL